MLRNYVHEITSGTTWPLMLEGALATGYRTVLGAFGAGAKALLTVRNRANPTEFEVALYTVNADGSINRSAGDVRDGSNGSGALVTFSSGIKDVICDADAAAFMTDPTLHIGNVSGATSLDLRKATTFTATITAATTISFINVPAGGVGTSYATLELTNGGSASITWPASVKWPGGTAPALTVSGIDVITFYTRDGGTSWRGAIGMKDSK